MSTSTTSPRVEVTEWDPRPHRHGKQAASSNLLAKAMEVGQVLRLYHPDVQCTGDSKKCSVRGFLVRQRKQGRRYVSYHEARHIMVIRREA